MRLPPPPRPTNERAKQALQTIRSLARVFSHEVVPADLDLRYGWALRTIFLTADDALNGESDAR